MRRLTLHRWHWMLAVVALAGVLLVARPGRADYPQPSVYPVSWECDFDHAAPRRIVVNVPGDPNPSAYWYITYRIANNTDRDRLLVYPMFYMLTEDGTVTRSDFNIAPAVFAAIKAREKNQFLQNANTIGGEILHGNDQSKDGVAIWREPAEKLSSFSIFVSGPWGENATVKSADGKEIRLRKTRQLDYHVNGAVKEATDADLVSQGSQFIMR